VHHRRLVGRLVDSHQWIEFEGRFDCHAVLSGLGIIGESFIGMPGGEYYGLAIGLFNSKTKLWAVSWFDSRDPHHIDAPVLGRFQDGVGTFATNDVLNEQLIRVRFLYTRTDTPSPRWEQAFSPDDGKTWETNWTMDFRKT
jgi:hypothetical protein